jgi:hypothetical protein
MEKIEEQLNSLSLAEIPVGTHDFVMRKVNYQKIKPLLFVGIVSFAVIFIATIWYINTKLVDAEFVDMMQDFMEVFDFNINYDSINTILSNFFEIISPLIFTSAILSLGGMIYIGKKITFNQFNFA